MKKNSLFVFFVFLMISSSTSYAWNGDVWDSISRQNITDTANEMIDSIWTPQYTIHNWAYGSQWNYFYNGTIYNGEAYSQNNPQESWDEFLSMVNTTPGGDTYYGNDCSGFVSIAWKLPSRNTTSTFESALGGSHFYALGAVGRGQYVNLIKGDALNDDYNHIILFNRDVASGIESMEQTPATARRKSWTWSQLSTYRPIRRSLIDDSFKAGDRIQTVTDLNVRSCPSTSCSVITVAQAGDEGTIIDGPQHADKYRWWKINFDGTTGWSVEGYLEQTSNGYASVSGGVTVTPLPVIIDQNFTVNFTLKEIGGAPISFEQVAIAILRPDESLLFDCATYNDVLIQANEIWSKSQSCKIYPSNSPGIYQAVIRGKIAGSWFDFSVTDSGVNPRSFPVEAPSGVLSVTPSDGFASSGNQGGPFNPPSKTYTLTNTGGSSITWSASKNQSWVSLSRASGTLAAGESTTVAVSINSNANNLAAGSYADTVRFADTTNGNNVITRSVNLTVVSCSYSISPTSKNFSASGGSQSVSVDTNLSSCSWSVSESLSWITVSRTSGTGDGSVTVTASANSGAARSGTVTIAGKSFSVSQDAASCTYSISPTSKNFGASGGSQSVSVDTNLSSCSWSVSESLSWITVSRTSGTGDGSVTVTASANSGAARSGTVTIAGKSFSVSQDAASCTYSISPTSKNFGASGGSQSVSVDTNLSSCSWSVSESLSWITVSRTSGTGDGSVTVTASANSGAARSGTVTIAGKSFSVSQDAASCTYSISPTSKNFGAGGGTGSVSVTCPTGCGWVAASNDAWITITSGHSGNGNGTVNYSVAANESITPRTGTMTIADKTFTVTQEGAPCIQTLSVTPQDGLTSSGLEGGPFSPDSKQYTLTNTGTCELDWIASKDQDWVSLSLTSGTLAASQSTTVTVSINSNADSLEPGSYGDTVSFVNTDGEGDTTRPVDLTVIPSGYLSVTPADGLTSIGNEGGPFNPSSKVYTLENTGGSPINWTAAKGKSWVTLSSAGGTLAAGASTTVTVSLNSNANSLAAGSYSDTVSFTNTTNGNGNATRSVSLTVIPVGSLSVTPTSGLTSSGNQGGPFSPSSKAYTLTNTGGSPINWTAAKGQPWVTLSSAGGTLAAGATTTVAVSINSTANSLTAGPYSDTVSFTNTTNGVGDTTRPVSLTVIPGESLSVTPSDGLTSSGNQGGQFNPVEKEYQLNNLGNRLLRWSVSKNEPWVTAWPRSGFLAPGANATVKVSINRNANSLIAGSYSDTVSFTNTTNGSGNTTRSVDLTVVPLPGVLSVTPLNGLTSTGNQGGPFNPSSKGYTLTNTGGSPINWTASNEQPWVTLSSTGGSLAAGANTSVTVSINSNADSLPAGSYGDTVSFVNTDGEGDTTRPVDLTVIPSGYLSVTPADGLTSIGNEGGPFNPSSKIYTLTNTGGSPVNWTATTEQPWVTLSSTSGTLAAKTSTAEASTTVTISINSNANNLAPGSFSDMVSFINTTNGNGDTTRSVSLTVNPVACLSITPEGGLTSSGKQGGPFRPRWKKYLLNNTGDSSISWTVSKNKSWLTIWPRSGTVAGEAGKNVFVLINKNAKALNPGEYTDTVRFSNKTNGCGDAGRDVSLTITPRRSLHSVAPGDFNGDGNLDLVKADSANSTLSVLFGNGDGSFQPGLIHEVVESPCSVAAGDLDGDGNLDLVVADSKSNTVSVLFGNGDGTFQPGLPHAVGESPCAVALGDLDKDGILDLVVADSESNDLSVLFGLGDGSFLPGETHGVDESPCSVALGDLDNDGHLDLVVADSESNDLSVLFGNGDGTFQPELTYGVGESPCSVTTGDLDNDGYLDLVMANSKSNTVSVLFGNDDGSFQPGSPHGVGESPCSVAVGDLDNDGILDLVVANSENDTVSVLLQGKQ